MYEKISSEKFQSINAQEMQSMNGGGAVTCDQVTVTPSGNHIDPMSDEERYETDSL